MTEQVSPPSGNTTISISGPGGTVTVSSPSESLAEVKTTAISLADKYDIDKAKPTK